MRTICRGLCAAVLAVSWTGLAAAQMSVPAVIPVQGFVSDSDGQAVSGNHAVELRLFVDAEGGTAVYAESHPDTGVEDGRFFVYLGDGDPPATARCSTCLCSRPTARSGSKSCSMERKSSSPVSRWGASPTPHRH